MKLKGYVFRSDGTPIQGATVNYYAAIEGTPTTSLGNTTTDSNGMWEFTGLSSGKYDVKVAYTVGGTSHVRWIKGLSSVQVDEMVVETAFEQPNIVIVRKTADESVSSSTTQQNDDHLSFSIGANEVWVFEMFLSVSGGGGGFSLSIGVPSGATIRYGTIGAGNSSTTDPSNAEAMNVRVVTDGTTGYFYEAFGNPSAVFIRGTVVNGGTGGTVQLKWAQEASNASATTVHANSHLIAYKVA